MENINFVTKTYDDEIEATTACASRIESIYPNSTFYVYEGGADGGLCDENKLALDEYDNTKLISWSDKNKAPERHSVLAKIENVLKKNRYTNHLLSEVFNYDFYYYQRRNAVRFDFFVRQKPKVIYDLSTKVNGNIIWLDADVVLIDRIDEIFKYKFDVAGTVRSKYESKYRYQNPSLENAEINSGVIFFITSSSNIKRFVRLWLRRIDSLRLTKLREQRALGNLFRESNPNLFDEYYNIGQLDIGSESLSLMSVPCLRYNHYRFLSGIRPSINKILHFKAGEGSSGKALNKSLLGSIKDGYLNEWVRSR